MRLQINPVKDSPRQRLLFDRGWRFYLGELPVTASTDERADHFPNAGTHVAGRGCQSRLR